MQAADVLVPFGVFAMLAFITHTMTTNIRLAKAAKAAAQIHAQALSKCTTGQEAISYLETGMGRNLFDTNGATSPASQRILSAVTWGAILLCVGIAALLLQMSGVGGGDREALLVAGSLSLAVGIGFLMAAGSSYVLCRNWGLLARADGTRG